MNAIKMKWSPAATGVNKDWIPNDFSINYEDIHKITLTKHQLPQTNLCNRDEKLSIIDALLEPCQDFGSS